MNRLPEGTRLIGRKELGFVKILAKNDDQTVDLYDELWVAEDGGVWALVMRLPSGGPGKSNVRQILGWHQVNLVGDKL